jgi:hypothetical protein
MKDTTELLRQAHPNFLDGESITSQVFFPFPKDAGKLSVDDGDQITARDAFEFYTTVRGNVSDSVWSITVLEASECGVPRIHQGLGPRTRC